MDHKSCGSHGWKQKTTPIRETLHQRIKAFALICHLYLQETMKVSTKCHDDQSTI